MWSCRDVDSDLWDAALLSEFLRTLYLSFFEIAYQIDYWAWCQTPWQTVTDWCDCSAAWMESPSEESCWYTPVADTWRFIFLNWFLWLKHTHVYTQTHTHTLIAVCCPSSWLAQWKGHLTKPLTGRCNTCVCSELSATERRLWALPWQEKHCEIWLTGLPAGWRTKADSDTNTIETVIETTDGTQNMLESNRGLTYFWGLLYNYTRICQHVFTRCIDT